MTCCLDRGIPKHLWKNGRELNDKFEVNEKAYRRFNLQVPKYSVNDGHNSNSELKQFTGQIFQLEKDSYNRSLYCEKPIDVLYNDKGEFKEDYGIFEIDTSEFFFTFQANVNNKLEEIEVMIRHDPLKCNYPHCVLEYKVAGETPEYPKPGRMIKNFVREQLFHKINIIKHPTP